MTTLGSTYATAKAALLAQLDARSGLDDVAVAGEPPVEPLKVMGPTGSGKAIWIADAEGDYDVTQMCGVGRIDFDEPYELVLVIQALPLASETQANTDLKVDQMLGEVLLEITADPTLGLTQFQQFVILPSGFRRFVGPIEGRNLRPSRCELSLEVQARVSLTSP